MVTLQQRNEIVARLRQSGHNCAQCVMLAFPDLTDGRINADTASALTSALGGGVGGTGHICGVLSAMACLNGLHAYSAPADKGAVYADTASLIQEFAERNGGLTDCRSLRRPGSKPCGQLIAEGVEIMHRHLEKSQEK